MNTYINNIYFYNITKMNNYRKKIQSTERNGNLNSNNRTKNNSTEEQKKSLNKRLIILIVVALFLIIIVGVFIFKKIWGKINANENGQSKISGNALSKEEALKAFEPNFKISSKTNKLNQILMKSNLKYTSNSNGIESTILSVFTKAKFDLYTLNESYAEEDNKEFYSRKFCTVITINSMCTIFSANKTDCELDQYLDLNAKNKNLKRIDEEEAQEVIKESILPICIIEHTDTNIIISVTCPETLSSNLKEDIILSFQSIKPESFKGIVDDDSIKGTNITEKDNRKYIDLFIKGCDDYDGDPSINETCEVIKNIVTDLDGNLISMKQNSIKEIIKDEGHKNNEIKNYYIKDVSNSKNFDSNNYKKNLDNVFELIKPFMKKEVKISSNSFSEILDDLMKGDSNTTNDFRKLAGEKIDGSLIFEDKIFSKEIYGINVELSLKNAIGLDLGVNSMIITNLKTGKETKEISHNEANTKLNETINQFISLSKAVKAKASSLQEELNEPLLEIRNNINSNINALNNLLSFADLSPIFDSTLAISGLNKLPYTIVPSSENLYSYFNKINDDISYSIYDYKTNLKESLSSFLAESHQLLYYIFSNLTETSKILSSKKSKIAEITSYYLNNADTSFVDIIKKANEIVSNYYINEKNLIKPLIDESLNNFYNDSLISAEKIQTVIDTLVENLDSGILNINLGSAQDVKNVIYNIYKAKMKVKEILSNIVYKFNKSVGYQDSGYFESQKELDTNNKSYSGIISEANKIANTLDNNLLIDTTYDKIMKNFRNQFLVLLNYMDKSKREKFPLKENILENSTFTKENIDKIDQNFKNEKLNILLFVKNENNEYLKFVKETLDKYKKENQQNLDSYIINLEFQLSGSILDNLNSKYNEMLTSTINQIDKIIKDNNNLAVEYLKNVIRAGTEYCTSGYTKKYNIYINNLNIIINYVKLNLKNHLVTKYKIIINQIRSNLQKIKSNSMIEKYKNYLGFSEAHLRVIDNLFIRFDKYISDTLFNKNYLTKINNYVSNTKNHLDNLEKNLNNLYSQIQKNFPYSDSTKDYIKMEKNIYRCCEKEISNICFKRGNCYKYNNQGYNIKETNNHLNLTTIEFNQYTIDFDKFYSSIYNQVSNNINNYCNSINKLSTLFDSKKNELLLKNINYLSSFSNNVESILNNYLGFNLLNSSYNYFKNELVQKIPNELDDILLKWNEVYDKIDEDLNTNLNKFKSNIREFGLLGSFYYETYRENISYEYVESIIQKRKNDLNYTLKYYYNIISFKVNKTYNYIINNIPKNDRPFGELLNTRISQITNIYNNIITKIQNSRNQILSWKTQLSFLNLSESDFFLMKDYINDNADKIDKELLLRSSNLFNTSDKLQITDTDENAIAKFLIENSQSGKQIKEINEPINKDRLIELQNDVYQNFIEENIEIDKDELIKNILNYIKEFNEKIFQSYKFEKDKYSTLISNTIYKSLYSKENLEKIINYLYNNGLKELDEQSKNTITNEYLAQTLNNIKANINKEIMRLRRESTSYSNNYKVIEARLNEYKEKIYNEFYSTIISVVKDFYNQVKLKFYTNYIKEYLEYLTRDIKREKFKENDFLNMTINLKKTVEEINELLVNNYQNLSINQIEYLYNKNIQNLDKLFSFSSIKNKINHEISNLYNK